MQFSGNMRVLLLLCVIWGVGAEIGNNMNDLSRHLQQEMADVMDLAAVNYSEPVIVANYHASADFDMRAMGPLYNSTHMVLDLIVAKQAYPEGIVSISDGHLEIAPVREKWRPLLSHYYGPLTLVVCALLVAAILPLAGLFWCCCYWCRVGRRRRPFDRKYDACVKGLLAIILIGLLTLFLFGVVCLFATEEQVESGCREAGEGARVAIADARTFLNNTQAHARHLLVNNYNELAERLNTLLHTSGAMVSMKLSEFSRAVSVTTLNKLVVKLDDVQTDLRTVQRLTAALRAQADDLNAGLRKVRIQLLQTLAKCEQPKCIALQNKYKIGQLDTEIQYSQIPDVSELLNNVTALLEGNIKEEVGAGQKVFRDIQAAIRRSVQEHIPSVREAIVSTGKRLERVADEITESSRRASVQLGDVPVGQLDQLYNTYGPYRRAAGLAAAALPLLITCMLAWGLVCGVCGKRPDVYGASDCCNKGHGSKCLLCGVCVMFVCGCVSAALVAVYFAVGAAAQRFVCDPLTEPRDNRLFNDFEHLINFERTMYNENTDPNFNLTYVLVNCHQNKTIYETLQLWRRFDAEREREAGVQAVRQRVAALRPAFPRTTTILREGARRQLTALADAGLSEFSFERILHALDTNLTSLALDALAQQLTHTAAALQRPNLAEQADELARAATVLTQLHNDVVLPMHANTDLLNTTATRLRDDMRFNHSSLKEAINYLMHEATEAENFLNHQGPERLQNLTRAFAEVIEVKVSEYLTRVVHAATHSVGRCGPLSNAYNVTRDSACNKIFMATNGYWISMAWCLILFPPLMCVCVRLARLYLHVDVYPGPLVEAEYLYDAYADRDNVPLANTYKASKRVGRGRGAGAGAGAGAAGAAGPPPLDAHHARRYNDMAPKHWEEGPPRYHGPTEYERPPPYYYPGPNDRQ